jgi:hypothetical protein
MANPTKRLNIDIIANDKSKKALLTVQRNLAGLKNSVFSLQTAFATLGVGLIARDFLRAAVEVENLRIRFKFLFDTAADGEQAFKNLIKFAGQVPFQLNEIQQGAGSLAVVSDNAEELYTILQLTGDIAAASGLDFMTASEQIQKAFAGGIGAAQLFNERGVSQLLGFEKGVTKTGAEVKRILIDAFNNGTLTVKGASVDMANSFTGVMSMISDKYLQFKLEVMDASPFEFLKASLQTLDEYLATNKTTIDEYAQDLGNAIVDGAENAIIGTAGFIDAVAPIASQVKSSAQNILDIYNQLPAPLQSAGVLGVMILGKKGIATILAIDSAAQGMEYLSDQVLDAMGIEEGGFISGLLRGRYDEALKQARLESENLKQETIELQDAADGATESYQSQVKNILQNIRERMALNKEMSEQEEEISKTKQSILGSDFTKLQEYLMSEEEKLTSSYNKRLEIITNYLAQKSELTLEEEQKLNDARLELEDKYQKDLKKIREKEVDEQFRIFKDGKFQEMDLDKLTKEQKKDLAIKSGRELLEKMAQNNRQAFEMNKALATAEAVINTAQGVTKALASANYIQAFLIGAMGAVQVATIQSQQYQGRALGGRVQAGSTYMVGEGGKPEMFVPDQSGTIIPNSKLGGQTNIYLTVNANDTQGFDDLLVKRRSVIVNVINDALNSQGREALV